MATVILGAGIIGVSTAYYLSEITDPSTIHLVEASPTLFSSASGFAGGFLAKDWFSESAESLGAFSFAEHRRLAQENGGREKWGYSRSTGTTYAPSKGRGLERQQEKVDVWCREGTSRVDAAPEGGSTSVFVGTEEKDNNEPGWLSRTIGDRVDIVSEEGSTAQVNPLQLCQFLLSECERRGVQVHHPARAVSVMTDSDNTLSGIRLASTTTGEEIKLPCTHILISAGAWSQPVFKSLFSASTTKLPVTSLAGHSLVVRSPRWAKEHEKLGCHAIFTSDDQGYSPEIFSRIGGEIYVAGANSETIPLPNVATEAIIDEDVVAMLQVTAKRMLGVAGQDDDLEVVRQGLCFRPVTGRGTPILDRIGDERLGGVKTKAGGAGGVFLATGHGPWGISMSVGTGKVMAEMMTGSEMSADVSGLRL